MFEAILGQEAARCEDPEDTCGKLFVEGEVDYQKLRHNRPQGDQKQRTVLLEL